MCKIWKLFIFHTCNDSFATISLMFGSLIVDITSSPSPSFPEPTPDWWPLPEPKKNNYKVSLLSRVSLSPFFPLGTKLVHKSFGIFCSFVSKMHVLETSLLRSNFLMSGAICDCGKTIMASSPRLPYVLLAAKMSSSVISEWLTN